jgi:hypothetical protein
MNSSLLDSAHSIDFCFMCACICMCTVVAALYSTWEVAFCMSVMAGPGSCGCGKCRKGESVNCGKYIYKCRVSNIG